MKREQEEKEIDLPERILRFVGSSDGGKIARGIITAVVVLFGLYVLRNLIALFFISFIISLALRPVVDLLQNIRIPFIKRGIPRFISAISLILLITSLFVFVGIESFSILYDQYGQLSKSANGTLSDIAKFIEGRIPQDIDLEKEITEKVSQNFQDIFQGVGKAGNIIFALTTGVINGLFTFLTAMVLTIYFLVDESSLRRIIKMVLPEKREKKLREIEAALYSYISRWTLGQITVMLLVGVMSFVGYKIIGLEYAASLSIIAGMLEIVPVIGPLIAAVPAIIVGFIQSPTIGVLAIIATMTVQQIENNVFVPKILGSSVEMDAVTTLFVVMVGGTLFGVVGILLAVPTTIFIKVVLLDKYKI